MDKEAQEKIEKGIIGIEAILKAYSLELDDSGQDYIENEGFYYEYARRIYNAGYRNCENCTYKMVALARND